jgi:predicted glycogen debranching enzyme
MMHCLTLGREICGCLREGARREWLVTNGLGGYASGTVSGVLTRRYHGLLVAARRPPVARTVTLAKIDVEVDYDGARYALGANEYADGTIHPGGFRHLQSFAVEGTVPTWTWALGDALLEARVHMGDRRNVTYVTYSIARGSRPASLQLTPLCAWRDYHWHQHATAEMSSTPIAGGCEIGRGEDRFRLLSATAEFTHRPDWHRRIHHAAEAARGLDSDEDLYVPGCFTVTLAPGDSVTVVATAEAEPPVEPASALRAVRAREASLLARAPEVGPDWVRQLVLAADQFIVERRNDLATDAAAGTTVIAGYPWFGDWGRDTMIALPGLALATGRHEVAADILRTFARYADQGMLPNRFPEAGEAPEYNTVDATLWYFVAIHEYVAATDDLALARELLPTLHDIVDWHLRGTRHGIGVDPQDGLLRAGEPGVQLTWMDAKVDGWAVTPRIGKPVEISALWINALRVLAQLNRRLGEPGAAARLEKRAHHAGRAFRERFWYAAGGYLYDVIDVPGTTEPDATLRPNQVLALSLPYPVLDDTLARQALSVCERKLVTTFGLRTLSTGHPSYVGRYRGGPRERDGAYHQGTVWPWLLGPFIRAHLRAFADPIRARSYLEPMAQHLRDGCVGQVSEIFDGDAPHLARGCFAQAWSVAEILRAWQATRAHEDALTGKTPAPRPPSSRARRRGADAKEPT